MLREKIIQLLLYADTRRRVERHHRREDGDARRRIIPIQILGAQLAAALAKLGLLAGHTLEVGLCAVGTNALTKHLIQLLVLEVS